MTISACTDRPLRWPSGEASAKKAEDMGYDPCSPWSSHVRDLKTGSLVATLPGDFRLHHKASASLGLIADA